LPIAISGKMKTRCPRCDQGRILHARVRATGMEVSVCEECEALWPAGTDVAPNNFADLKTHLQKCGMKGDWSELEIVEE